MAVSEIEDLYNLELYQAFIENQYAVTLSAKNLGNVGVWSERVKRQFISQGKIWSEDGSTEAKLKSEIANLVVSHPEKALAQHRRSSFDALVAALERKLTPLS
jgi:hypothetical protein